MRLNDSAAATYAKDFTITALEHNMIQSSTDPKQTAEDVAVFYKTLVEILRKED